MRRTGIILAVAVCVGCFVGTSHAGEIELNLEAVLAGTGPGETVSALVYLADHVNLAELEQQLERGDGTLRHRHEVVVTALQQRAAATQTALLARLDGLSQAGTVTSYQAFWVANCVQIQATPAAIREIAARPEVETVYLDYPIEAIEPVDAIPFEKSREDRGDRTPEPGLVAIRAPEVWDMGFTGEGILVATLDTGVDGNHPALASRWRGVADARYAGHPEWAWFDPVTYTTFPQAFGSHGTHTMGTVCGGAPGDQIGVAPGAQWIHAAVIDRVSIAQTVADAILAFQWLIDPDDDPSTNWDVPRSCSNSWRLTTSHGYPPCDQTFWTYLDACESAGIVILFSAGNEGPSPQTIGRPPDRATDDYRCFAVGAINGNVSSYPIADFSSRGPSYCTPGGQMAIKPEVVAPGVDVRSSVPGGGYQSTGWSGTSMASPHVNGAVALIREACPDLSVEEVKQILLGTASDLGPAGEDNDYGVGIIDVYEAVNLALSLCSGAPRADDGYYETSMNQPVLVTLQATDYDGLPDPPGALTYIIDSLPASGILVDPGAGSVDTVPYALVDGGNEVTYQPDAWYSGSDAFTFKANDGGEPPDAGDSNIATIAVDVLLPDLETNTAFDFDSDPGWTIQGQWAFGQPTGGGTHNLDPTSGYTGANVYGYNLAGDYPHNMPEYSLTSTPINCRDFINSQLRFRRWLGVERAPYDRATVAVSPDGSTWTTVWQNPTRTIADIAWAEITFDISAVADRESTVYLRWTMGPTDDTITYPGWNIDDVEIRGMLIPTCPGDFDADGDVDLNDLAQLLAHYGMTGVGYRDGDVDGDSDVDLADLSALLAVYGTGCP
jgi:subtilisin family serine protease